MGSDGRRGSPSWTFFAVALLLVAAGVWLALRYAVPWILGALVGINVATILLYGYDKAVAGGRRTRVPENVLHLLAFLGGSPAALFSQSLFRHKTVKTSFRRMFWLIVVVQVTAAAGSLWWWRSRGG